MLAFLHKDWLVLRKQWMVPIMLVWSLGMELFVANGALGGMSLCLMCSVLPFMSISYDESVQYLRYALGQPLKRSDYVWSKYLPNLGLMLLWLVLLPLADLLGQGHIRPFTQILGSLLLPGLITAILLPLTLALGPVKARLAYMVIIFATVFLMGKEGQGLLRNILYQASTLQPWLLVAIIALLLCAMLGVSIILSIRLVNKKDY